MGDRPEGPHRIHAPDVDSHAGDEEGLPAGTGPIVCGHPREGTAAQPAPVYAVCADPSCAGTPLKGRPGW